MLPNRPRRSLNLQSGLSAKCSRAKPAERVTAAWEAGVASRVNCEDLVRPPSWGLANTCWLGIRVDHTAWLVVRKRTADTLLRKERATRLVAFPSQAEAEAWIVGLGLEGLPSPQSCLGVLWARDGQVACP